MNLENFEKRCDEIREENEKYLQIFKEDNRNLSPKTISRHVDNVSFYINEYLLRNEPLNMDQWLEECARFNNPDEDDDEFVF